MRLLLFLLCFTWLNLSAQEDDSLNTKKWAITFSPSAFLNNLSGVQFGIEKTLNDRNSIELEGARIFRQPANVALYKEGYRVKLGFKRRFSEKTIFLSTIYFRKSNHHYNDWVWRFNNTFFQRINYTKERTLIGPTLGIGFIETDWNPFHFEFAVNLGVGIYYVRNKDVPEDVEEVPPTWAFYHDPNNYPFPIIGISMKLKYAFGERTKS